MSLSISGLSSGFDWQSVVSQLRAVEEQKVTALKTKQTTAQSKLSAWQTLASKLETLNTASADLKSSTSFDLFSATLTSSSADVTAKSLLSATASTSATKGTYEVVVNNTAKVEKLGSQSYTSKTTALGVTGSILVNGVSVNIEATDTLGDVSTKINAANSGDEPSGVVSSILRESANSYKLVLTSEEEGAAGISLLNGSGTDTLAELGFNSTGTKVKNSIVGGAQSDTFTSKTTSVESLLGNESQALSGNVLINGVAVTIDLSDSLETIKDNLVSAGISASVVSETKGTDTVYRLQIENLTSWSDNTPADGVTDTNVLQALGVIEGKRDNLVGVTSSVKNTTDGSTAITSSTKLSDIYGYTSVTAGDKITISGQKHDSGTENAVAATDFAIDANTTVGDLLTQVESLFGSAGDVTASITADGKIQVVDNKTGTSSLAVNLQATVANGALDFGSFSTVGDVRKYVIQQGEDASFSIDGIAMTSSSNTVTTAIPGVTMNLAGEDPNTTVTMDIDNDGEAIEKKVQTMLDAYNEIIGYINTQMSYNSDTKTTGGVLFGDNNLKEIKNSLQSAILSKVNNSTVNYLTDVGITIGSDNKLSLDSDEFQTKLASNYNDVVKLFSDSGTGSNSSLKYSYSSRSTQSGTYNVEITSVNGSNVTGTINGVSVSGTNGILTVNDSTNSANGLQILYSGTTTMSGTFSYSRGIASLLENAMNTMTDSVDGTVTTVENSLQSGITDLDTKMTDTESLISRKMNVLTTRFQTMEVALSQINSMSSYVSKMLG